MNSPASWMLAGGDDLDKHIGHKVQVTGKTNFDSTMDHGRSAASTPATGTSTGTTATSAGTTGTSGTTATAASAERKEMRADQPKLEVESVKMVSPSCS
jgi:hypothetical protein